MNRRSGDQERVKLKNGLLISWPPVILGLRIMLKSAFLALLVAVLSASPAAAQPTIFLVRHAERADTAQGTSPAMAADPDLSEAGRFRRSRSRLH